MAILISVIIMLQRPDVLIKAIEDLRTRWDWSKVKAELVPSIAGRHEGWPRVLLTGHCRLMRAVRNMGMRTGKGKGKNVSLEYQVRAHLPYMFWCLKRIMAGVKHRNL
jgi:tyrosyl-DNA phosphodiesterase-1